jgi:hemerythrin superfamily protein
MDLYGLLKEDHEKVKSLFEELEKTGDKAVKKREELFSRLKTELTIHANAEEKFYYPRLKDEKESRDTTLEAFEEHKVAKRLLKELEAMPKEGDEWAAKLKVLMENVEHHIKEEENELFPQSKKVLSRGDAEQIMEDIETYKEEQSELVETE